MKKDFALINILAEVTFIAIVVMIIVPIVLKLTDKNKDATNRLIANNYISQLEELIKSSKLNDGKYIVNGNGDLLIDNEITKITMSGGYPASGTIIISKGKIEKIKNLKIGSYQYDYINKELIGKKINPRKYKIGETIYFDVTRNVVCTESLYTANLNKYKKKNNTDVATGLNTGCMKFNVISANTYEISLLLDHNTTAHSYFTTQSTSLAGPKELLTKLYKDTDSWNLKNRYDFYTYYQTLSGVTSLYQINYTKHKARLITADEIANITKANRKYTVRWSTNKTYTESVNDITKENSWYYFDGKKSKNNTTYSAKDGWQKKLDSKTSKYEWLFNYTNNCESYGCKAEDNNSYKYDKKKSNTIEGYWTSTAVFGTTISIWGVGFDGSIKTYNQSDIDKLGIRPVITVLNNNLNVKDI